MPPHVRNRITVQVVTSGQAVSVSVNIHEPTRNLVKEALREAGSVGQPLDQLELTSANGRVLSLDATVETNAINDGDDLFLAAKVGAGG